MQVRNILQYKKQPNTKNNKNKLPPSRSKQKKRIKTNRTLKTNKSESNSKSKSKSKSKEKQKDKQRQKEKNKSCWNSEKENKRYMKEQGKSRSREKISPIKISNMKGYNTSPVLMSQRCEKVRPSLNKNKNVKGMLTQRGHQEGEKFHTISTKLNTQRTPVKKLVDKDKDKSKDLVKKPKKSQKKKIINQQKKIAKNQMKEQIKMAKGAGFKKLKKIVAPINTNGPQRKQSYFDQQLIEKLNLDNAQFFRKKHPQHPLSPPKIPKHNTSVQINISLVSSITKQQRGTEPVQILHQNKDKDNNIITIRQLQAFRKQQQLKWRIMYLELNQLKQMNTPDKIDQIIEESYRNISEFQTKCQQISQMRNKDQYIIESPSKIRDAMLGRRRKSQDQSRSLVKSLSDQRLLQQLENLDYFDQVGQFRTNSRQEKPSSSSFCVQFQKQMENYTLEHAKDEPGNSIAIQMQMEHIPEMEYEKSMQVYSRIEESLFIQLCGQLAESQRLLHSFLLVCRARDQVQFQYQQQKQNNNQLKIKCTEVYSIDLLYRLFKFIEENNYQRQIIERVNKPFSGSDLANLKLLRNYFVQNQQDVYQDNESIEIVIDSNLLNLFESENYTQPIQSQYFYNHCIYSCFNELLDTVRPYGLSGPPPFHPKIKPIHQSISTVFSKVLQKYTQILKVKMGKQDFNEFQLEMDPLKIAEKSYEIMDRFLVSQEEEKWKKVQDNVFEEKYFLAEAIITDIFNQEIMMIYNEFI